MFEQTGNPAKQGIQSELVEAQWQSSFSGSGKGPLRQTKEAFASAPYGTRAMLSIVESGDANKNGFLEITVLNDFNRKNAKYRAGVTADLTAKDHAGFESGQLSGEALERHKAGVLEVQAWDRAEIVKYDVLDKLASSATARQAVAKLHPDVTKPDGTKVGPEEISTKDAEEYVLATRAQFGLSYLKAQSNNIDKKYGNGDGKLTDAELSKTVDDPATHGPLRACLAAAQTHLRRISGLEDASKATYTEEQIGRAAKIVSEKLPLDLK